MDESFQHEWTDPEDECRWFVAYNSNPPSLLMSEDGGGTWGDADLVAVAAEILRLAERERSLTAELSEMKERLRLTEESEVQVTDQAVRKIASLEARIAELQSEVERRARENVDVQDRRRALGDSVIAVARYVARGEERFKNRIAELESALRIQGERRERAEARVRELVNTSAEVIAERDRLRARVAELEEVRDRLGRSEASLKTQNGALEAENASLKNTKRMVEIGAQQEWRDLQRRLTEVLAENASLKDVVETRVQEAASLRKDLRAAIKAAEELAEKIEKKDAAISALEECRRSWLAWCGRISPRLARLDELLASETPPEGLFDAIRAQFDKPAIDAWDWFRGQFGAATGEKLPTADDVYGILHPSHPINGGPGFDAEGRPLLVIDDPADSDHATDGPKDTTSSS